MSRFGDCSTRELWAASAKTLALWQITLTGTLFLYQGQEIGMTNMPREWGIEEYKDVESRSFWAESKATGDAKRIADTLHGLAILARDHSRIPFQWSGAPNAGFTAEGAKSWMRVHDNYREINAEKQANDPSSVLSFYKKVLRLRKEYRDLFVFGTFQLVAADDEALFAYVKRSPAGAADSQRKALVLLNFSAQPHPCPDVRSILGCAADEMPRLLVGTVEEEHGNEQANNSQPPTMLRAWEGRVYLLC